MYEKKNSRSINTHTGDYRLNLPPFLELRNQISDSTSYINVLSVQRSGPAGKHSDQTAPTPLERGFVETAPHHACNTFGSDVTIFLENFTSTFNLTHELLLLL